MKRIFLCRVLLCIALFPVAARAQVRDDFSDGDFTNNPRWTGDSLHFEVNTAGQLHLRSQGIDTSVLATPGGSYRDNEWRFWMKLSFNTSANNFARVYLASETANPPTAGHCWFLQAGGTGDSIVIYKQQGSTPERVYAFHSFLTNHSANALRFRITRDGDGHWDAMVDTTGGTRFLKDGSFSDPAEVPAGWFALWCRYTSSNATKFYFDDIYAGPVVRDTVRPAILAVKAVADSVIRVSWSEETDGATAWNPANYLLGPAGLVPGSATAEPGGPATDLYFHERMADGFTGTLSVRNVTDLSGNVMRDTVLPAWYYRPKAYDVVISEIMADPSPPVDLPEGEYVELYNRTAFPVDLEGWRFCFGSSLKEFPEALIPPHGRLLVAKDSVWFHYSACALLFTSSTSLSNEGTTLALKDRFGHVVHSVTYSPDWFGDSFKAGGGWSLEMADPGNPCGCAENWGPSSDPSGGTPGRANSAARSNPDLQPPYASRAVITDSSTVAVIFSESLDSTTVHSSPGWAVTTGEAGMVLLPDTVTADPPGFGSVNLHFGNAFRRGIIYLLQVPAGLKDCAGNPCDTTPVVRFAIPDYISARDIVINEILSNPASGGARFVELYNNSGRIADMQELVIANRDTAIGLLPGAAPLFSSGYLLFPGEYLALTPDPGDIIARYHSPAVNAIRKMEGFPVFGDDTGTVVLARRDNLAVIDRVHYDPDMHYPLLATTEGVSLERASPDRPSAQRDNWHSAAGTSGYATPGYVNSHSVAPAAEDGEVTVSPKIFSPDNDGRDDLLTITVNEPEPDYTVSIGVWDAAGRLVRQLVSNVLAGSRADFTWDGMTETRHRAPVGIYILSVLITRPDGRVTHLKRTAVVAGKF